MNNKLIYIPSQIKINTFVDQIYWLQSLDTAYLDKQIKIQVPKKGFKTTNK